jgi:hypothetical protein
MAWPAALSQKSDFSDAIAATGGIERRNGWQFLLFRSIFARLRRRSRWPPWAQPTTADVAGV